MENQFAKVFNFPTGQLLVTLDLDEDGEYTRVTTRTDRSDVQVGTVAKFNDSEEALNHFESLEAPKVEDVFDQLQKMLKK